MKKIETNIAINASADKVWDVLTDFQQYNKWNPFIKRIKGTPSVGNNIEVRISPPEGKGMTFKPMVLVFDPNKEFRWVGKLGVKGLFDGEHYFIIEPTDQNKINFIHGEKFSGMLVGIFGNVINDAKNGFDLMNNSLKEYCENKK